MVATAPSGCRAGRRVGERDGDPQSGEGELSPGKAARGGGTPATVALTKAGVEFTLHPYDHAAGAPSYGGEAADALGLSHDEVFKTLVARVDGRLVTAAVPVSGSLDLKALAAALGAKKAAMAEPADAERATGYVVGGISLLGQRSRMESVVDESVLGLAAVYVSAGRRGLQVRLAPADLLRVSAARTARLGRPG
jgi:Cys-tRNA(Pro)/Cys-tRNA(Cys) deacylase